MKSIQLAVIAVSLMAVAAFGQTNSPPAVTNNTVSAAENVAHLIVNGMKDTEVIGGYGVIIKNRNFKNSERGAMAGLQGDVWFHTTSSSNNLAAGPFYAVLTEPNVTRQVIGLGGSATIYHPPKWLPGGKNSVPIIRNLPGDLSEIKLQVGIFSPVDKLQLGIGASATIKAF